MYYWLKTEGRFPCRGTIWASCLNSCICQQSLMCMSVSFVLYTLLSLDCPCTPCETFLTDGQTLQAVTGWPCSPNNCLILLTLLPLCAVPYFYEYLYIRFGGWKEQRPITKENKKHTNFAIFRER